ncbi:MAG: hypothetical protein AAFU77_07855 [Myxococcota bacterium]
MSRACLLIGCLLLWVVLAPRTALAQVSINGFADFTFVWDAAELSEEEGESEAEEDDDDDRPDDTFSSSGLNLLLTSEPGSELLFLGEVNLEIEDADELELELERVQLAYRLDDAFELTVGIQRLQLGWFRPQFSERGFLFDTASVPTFLQDEPAVVPESLVGVTLNGQFAISDGWFLGYRAGVGNGRGPVGDSRLQGFDIDAFKAVHGGVFARLSNGSVFGIDGYFDRFNTVGLEDVDLRLREQLLTAYANLVFDRYTVTAEWIGDNLVNVETDEEFQSQHFYGAVSATFGDFRPTLRYEFSDFEEDTPYYGLEADDGELEEEELEGGQFLVLAVAYQLYALNLVKFEVRQGLDDERLLSFLLQTSWAF